MVKHYITSSLGTYFLILGAFNIINSGFNKLFGLYLVLSIALGAITAYQIYIDGKKENKKSITYYFFAFDRLTAGLLLASFYFNLIDISSKGSERLLLVIGIILILGHFKRLKK